MAVRHRPDDVLGPERRVAAEEDARIGRLHGDRVDLRHVPFVEFEADVALDPGERILLPDRHQHVVAFDVHIRLAGRHQIAAALRVVLRLHLLEHDAGELAVVVREFLRHQEIEDRDAFALRVLLLPGLAFISSKPERTTTFTSSPPRRREVRQQSIAVLPPPSTITRLPIFVDVAERNADSQSMPIWMLALGFLAARNVQLAAARRAAADEDRVIIFRQQRLQAVDALAQPQLRLQIENVIALLVQHASGRRNFGICVRIMPPACGSAS